MGGRWGGGVLTLGRTGILVSLTEGGEERVVSYVYSRGFKGIEMMKV